MLEIKQLETGYGKKQVLFGLSMAVQNGEIVAIIGPNGAGKSTILKAVHGLLPSWSGNLLFEGHELRGCDPAKNVSKGITFAPQGNRVFDELSVMENLEIGGFHLPKQELKERIDIMCELFPVLKERAKMNAGKLSGGEQQMLALARVLIPKPRLLMLDEPPLGLSPNLVELSFQKIKDINEETGTAVLIVEQKVREVLKICHKVYSIKLGKVAFEGAPEELTDDREKLRSLFL